MQSDATLSQWLTIPEVALRLRLSRMTIYRLCAKGDIIHYRVGRQVRIRATDFDDYLAAARQNQAP